MGPWGPPDTKLPASSSIVGFKRPVRVFSDFEGGSPKSILGKFPLLLGPTFYMDGAKSVLVPNWLLYTLGAKLTPVSNWYRCQIDSFYTLGAKLVPVPNWLLLHSWCQIDSFTLLVPNWFRCQIDSFTLLVPNWSGAKLTPVPNWLRCQIGAGAKLSSNRRMSMIRGQFVWTLDILKILSSDIFEVSDGKMREDCKVYVVWWVGGVNSLEVKS